MAETFVEMTTVRLKSEVRDRIRMIAQHEGNPEAAVLRRALMMGLDAIEGRELAVPTDERGRPS